MDVHGKVAVVTGAARGIECGIARALPQADNVTGVALHVAGGLVMH